MVTKRVGENGVLHPGWDGKLRPATNQTSRILPNVQVTDEQRQAAARYLVRMGAADLIGVLDLQEVTP